MGWRCRAGHPGRAVSFAEFASMGGYGFYVWGSYLACAVGIAVEIVAVRARLAAARRDAGDMEIAR
jgi:heme exporter protein CcmD